MRRLVLFLFMAVALALTPSAAADAHGGPPIPPPPGPGPSDPPPPPAPAKPDAPAAPAPPARTTEVKYLGPDEVKARMDAIAARPASGRMGAKVERYGTSSSGRPLWVLRMGPSDMPQVLVHGGVGSRDSAGVAAALDFADSILPERVAGSPAPPAADVRVGYLVIPAPNPDALAAFLAGKPAGYGGGGDVDRDRDGKRGEDGPDDLDGDGEVLEMRRRRPAGSFVVDETPAKDGKSFGDPRLMKDGGVDARRAVSYDRPIAEGRDDDGDGEVNEDPAGTDLQRNFIGVWEEMGAWPGDGTFPGSAPEIQALMELSFDTGNLIGWYEFTSEGPRLERASERGKDADVDDALYGLLAPKWKDLSGGVEVRKASERPGAGDNPGSDLDWAARHLGVVALRVPVWRIPKEAGSGRERADPDELDWLLWNDRVLQGKGFVAWHEVKHPTWGVVEVGGWKRYTRYEPPADLLPGAVRAVSRVPTAHAELAPRLDVLVEVERLGPDQVKVKARVANLGGGPTETKRMELAARANPVRLDFRAAEGARVVAGPATTSLGTLAAGGVSAETVWIVSRAGAGPLGKLLARHRIAGTAEKEVAAP